MRYPFEDDQFDDIDSFEDDEENTMVEGCLFPGKCIIAYQHHYTCECHTPEMLMDLEAEHLVPEAIDYLISRGFTPEDFKREYGIRKGRSPM